METAKEFTIAQKIRVFERYLKERGIYAAFFREAARYAPKSHKLSVSEKMRRAMKSRGYGGMINFLLHWIDTREGYDFWSYEDYILFSAIHEEGRVLRRTKNGKMNFELFDRFNLNNPLRKIRK